MAKRFENAYRFCNGGTNKFCLILRKGVYPYECMLKRHKFNETSLLKNKKFYNNLTKENITNVDYEPAKKVRKDFQMKNLSEYLDLFCETILYYEQMYLQAFARSLLRYMNLTQLNLFSIRINMVGIIEENKSLIRTICRRLYVTDGRK